MSEKKRAFVALKIYPEKQFLKTFNHFKTVLRKEAVRWVNADNLHLTLKFFGDSNHQQIDFITNQLEIIKDTFSPFELNIKGTGYFKNFGIPRVLFFNVLENEKLELLHSQFNKIAENAGFRVESRVYKPHLTLGRFKNIQNKKLFYDLLESYREIDIQTFEVREIILYESILKPEGPIYIPLKNVKLKNIL